MSELCTTSDTEIHGLLQGEANNHKFLHSQGFPRNAGMLEQLGHNLKEEKLKE